MNNEKNNYNPERVKIIEKIKEYEKKGGDYFFVDVEDDPPFSTLMPEDVDYLKKKFTSKIKTAIATVIAKNFNKTFKKKYNIQVIGEENLRAVSTGGIITSNHFSRYENLCVYNAVQKADKKRKVNFVIREGNYFMPGSIGFMLKNYYTLPLSSNMRTMINFKKAVKELLNRKEFILIYPEQSMWWNYRKPKPFKSGAFTLAVQNNVPIVPCFVTMKVVAGYDEDGFPNQEYTIHVMNPIYPNKEKTSKENVDYLMSENFRLCKEKYEEVYGVELKYDGGNFII